MIRLPQVPVSLDATPDEWPRVAAGILKVAPEMITACRLVRRSVDARHKDDVRLALTLDVQVTGDEAAVLGRCGHPQAALVRADAVCVRTLRPARMPARRPIVVGCGPAGLFAALTLSQAGLSPLLIERGQPARERRAAVEAFWRSGVLDPQSNVQFGEGGAGTFSDGKLNTGIKNPRCREVLETLVHCGAPEEILWQARPHIGTDRLADTVGAVRAQIEALGGTVRFGAQLDGLFIDGGTLRGIVLGAEQIETDAVILAIGHSARDTFAMLRDAGVVMLPKPFSIGARIEHPQAWIDLAQYGRFAGHPQLGAAEYRLSARLKSGRGAYTFCMCPGGAVVGAASEPGCVVTNGMSDYARNGANANSALLVDVRPEDFGTDDPLGGMLFQQKWERKAFEAGGGGYRAPAQLVGDLLKGRASRTLGEVRPTYAPGVVPADLRACLPGFVTDAMAEALPRFDRQLAGFAAPNAVLTGVETRSSSPVRIPRDDTGQANLRGVFPAGEGAGYAGGILSAALDGIRAAEWVIAAVGGCSEVRVEANR